MMARPEPVLGRTCVNTTFAYVGRFGFREGSEADRGQLSEKVRPMPIQGQELRFAFLRKRKRGEFLVQRKKRGVGIDASLTEARAWL